MFISVPAVEGGLPCLRVAQIVSINVKQKLVRLHRPQPVFQHRFPMAVQPWEIWSPWGVDLAPASLDIYQLSEVENIDFIQDVIDVDSFRMDRVCRWQATSSDVDGCIQLVRPEVVSPNMPLSHHRVPILVLKSALDSQGFVGVDRRVVHERGSPPPHRYDRRHLTGRRCYLQCVLRHSEILRHRESFPSDLSESFYNWLQKAPAEANAAVRATECRARVLALEGNVAMLQSLQTLAPAARRPVAGPLALRESDSDSAREPQPITWGEPDALRPNLAAATTPVAGGSRSRSRSPSRALASRDCGPEGSSSSSSESSSSSSSDSSQSSVAHDAASDVPAELMLNGQALGTEESDGRLGYRVACVNPAHRAQGCRKCRAITADQAIFGPRAAIIYLKCWHSMADGMEPARHHKKRHLETKCERFLLPIRTPRAVLGF